MAAAEDFDDDYVARLLAEDAKKTSQKYSSQGLSAFLPQRRAVDAPKPNTRFLSHIVREADSHNAALKRKEQVEAKKRLRELHGQNEGPRKRARADETADSKRSRLLKDIVSAASSGNTTRHRHGNSSRRGESRQISSSDGSKDYSRRRGHGSRERDHRSDRKSGRRKSTSPDSHRKERSGASHKISQSKTKEKHRDRHDESEDEVVSKQSARDQSCMDQEEYVQKRGRGALKDRTGMDARFEEGYDPSQDISLDSDEGEDAHDWDMALEAMRDRAKWKRNQAARMREAGFDEKDVTKWEKSSFSQRGHEPDLADVKWSRKGEAREWDAGKVQQ